MCIYVHIYSCVYLCVCDCVCIGDYALTDDDVLDDNRCKIHVTYVLSAVSGESLNSKKELFESPSSHLATVSPRPFFDNRSIKAVQKKFELMKRLQ